MQIIINDISSQLQSAIVHPAENIIDSEVNEIIKNTGGLFTVSISSSRAEEYGLSLMGSNNLPMTTSVEARTGVTTGISAADRAVTIRLLGAEKPVRRSLVQPGHIFPVIAASGTVLEKHDIFNGALDLVTANGSTDAAVVVTLINTNTGEPYTSAEIEDLSKRLSLPVVKLSELIAKKMQERKLVERVADAKLPTFYAGDLKAVGYRSIFGEGDHIALIKGEIDSNTPVLCRVQAEDLLSDILGDENSSRDKINKSLQLINESHSGIFIYLRKPEKNLTAKTVQELSPVRAYGIGCQILKDLGVKKIRSITTSATPHVGLEYFGIEVVEYVKIGV